MLVTLRIYNKRVFDCSNTRAPLASVFDRYKVCLLVKWNNDIKKPIWTKQGYPKWVRPVHTLDSP